MKLVFLLSFLINWHPVNGCLKMNRLSPCGCHALALDSSNIRDYVDEDNQSFSFLPNSSLKAPNVNIDECSIEMTCGLGYNLAIFDAALLIKWFNDYPAVGFCNPETREWSILTRDTGFSQFVELYGTCVYVPTTTTVTTPTTSTITTPTTTTATTTKPTTTTVTTPTTTTTWTTPSTASSAINSTTVSPGACPCQRRLLDSFNIRDYITEDSIFYPVLTSPSIVAPTNNSECSGIIFCPATHYLLIFDDTGLRHISSNFPEHSCHPETETWSLHTGTLAGHVVLRQIYGVCLEKGDETDSSSTQNLTLSSTTNQGITSTTETKSTTTGMPTTNGKLVCHPTDPRTFLFAYSTDFAPDVVTKVFNNFANKAHPIYTRIATVRFDLRIPESGKLHDSWEEANKTLHSRLPDPSLGFNDDDYPTDIRLALLIFFDEHPLETFCGIKIWVLLKRGDSEYHFPPYETMLLVRAWYGTIDLLVANRTSGRTQYNFVTLDIPLMTNGMAYFHNDEDFDRATKLIPTPSLPYLYYAQSSKVSNVSGYAGCCGFRVLAPATVWIAASPFQTPSNEFLSSNVLLGNSSLSYSQYSVVLHFTKDDLEIQGYTNHYGGYVKLEPGNYTVRIFNNYTEKSLRYSQTCIYSDVPVESWDWLIDS